MTLVASEKSAEPSSSSSSPDDDAHVFGHQRPRILTVPSTRLSSAGQEAVDLAARAGLQLDPWQQFVLDQGMSERADGNWAAFEVAVNVPRQNGKGGIIEARELWGLFIGGEKLILHSAHEFKTAKNAFKRVEALIRRCPDLHKRVKNYRYTVGEEAIELHTGQTLRFIARSKGSGRGFTGDCNILDEDMILGDDAMDALMPTMAAVANPQLWYLGSAGIGAPSVQLGRLRRRALAAIESGVPDPSLAYFEWSINEHAAECTSACTEHDDVDAPESPLIANPAIGYRLTLEKTTHERLSMGAEGYARERLGVGSYPSDGSDTWQVIGEDAWRALAAAESAPEGTVAFAVDMTPERSHAAIAVAGAWRGGTHVEVVDHRPGTAWVVARAKELHTRWKPKAWIVDAGGPAGSLIQDLADELGVEIVSPKTREVAQAAGQFYDAVTDQSVSHLDQAPLATALAGAQKRPLGDAWAWARRGVTVDISPLVAVTLAKWGLGAEVEDEIDPLDNIW
ncbi:terminase [Streptomyces sp. NBC_00987]|uniref:terminase n=1 Tax=Streptomyces sp. NBC_00987 TaxID=2903703 RepID=UPI0038700AD3|nr:terminase [Streptomyces sp. NBC_00987]